MIDLRATIHRISIDREGESTITIKVPAQDLVKAQSLAALLEEVLAIRLAKLDMEGR